MTKVPHATFKTRVRNDALGGPNPFEWRQVTSRDIFAGSQVVSMHSAPRCIGLKQFFQLA